MQKSIQMKVQELGREYTVKVIDWEEVIYRDFGNGFNVEISGFGSKKRYVDIYLWFGKSVIVETAFHVKSMNIAKTVNRMHAHSEKLRMEGKATSSELMEVKHD